MEEFGQESSMKVAVTTVAGPSAGPSGDSLPVWDRLTWLVAIPLALIVMYAFIPILNNGFVLWDDNEYFLENLYFRGLGAAQIKWAWTTFWIGVYQPLAWLLYGAQYVLWQLEPRGYHLTSLLLQIADAVVLYVLTVALLVRCQNQSCLESPRTCSLGAGLASRLFAVHPLRVEVVAWATAQMYLPCILFSMLSVLAYLRAFGTSSSPRWGWLVGSFLLFVTALLFHALPVTLPAVLLILDVYPLRRFPDGAGRWFGARARRALLEKVPFVMTSLLFMGLAIAARPGSEMPIDRQSTSAGIARACYAIWFYIWKTLLPLDLIAVYPLPREPNWLALPYSLCVLATLAMSAGLFLLRRRWPGLLAAWLSYLLILSPNSGIIRIGDQIVADRYSYMAMLSSVVLAAAGFCRLWRMSSRWHPGAGIGMIAPRMDALTDVGPSKWHPGAGIGMIALGLGVLLGLTALTRIQCRTWLNSETLWAHDLAHGGNSSFVPHHNFGLVLFNQGKYEAAEAHFTEALRLTPGKTDIQNNLGTALARQRKFAEAAAHFAEAVRLDPGFVKAHFNLGLVHAQQGNYKEAAVHYANAIRLQPGNVGAHFNLGNVLFRLGNYEAAQAHYAEAIRLDPGYAEAYNASGLIMAACAEAKFRDGQRAVALATRACELTKWKDPRFLSTLAAAQAEAGDFNAAVSSQTRAIELLTDQRQQDDYRSRLVLYQAKKPYRQESPQLARLKLAHDDGDLLMEELGQESTMQVALTPVAGPIAGPSGQSLPVWDRRTCLVVVPLALVVIYAFAPVLDNGFVNWDDTVNFLYNPYFRGLGTAQLRWAWTTFWTGTYRPLAWMLFETEYVFCKLDPRGYHLTSLLLQVATAVVLYIFTMVLLVRCGNDSRLENRWPMSLSAGLATALFMAHPLRVEVVAWATVQSYMLCALFSMLAVLAYLHAFGTTTARRWSWLVGSFLLFVTALLFHAVAVSLPAVLLVLDAYPLRRFWAEPGRWFGPELRRVLWEKVPFLIASLVFMGLAIAAKPLSRFPVRQYPLSQCVARACYGIWFYVIKTIWPFDLIAVYPLPKDVNWFSLPYSVSIVATLVMSAVLILLRHRWPGLLAAWVSYLVILAPNSGLILSNDQIAADRYSCISMLGFVPLLAAGLCQPWKMSLRSHPGAGIGMAAVRTEALTDVGPSKWHPGAGTGMIALGLGALLGLTALTRNQCRTWLNPETLWAHALSHGGNASYVAQHNFGLILFNQGKYEAAEAHLTEAMRLFPGHTNIRNNLGTVLARGRKYAEAEAQFAEAIRLDPGFVEAHFNLGLVHAGQGNYREAEAHYAEAVRLQPGNGGAHLNLGNVLSRLGNYEAAKAHYAAAIRLDPGHAEAYNASALIMAACPEAKFRDGQRAVALATCACALTKWKDPRFLNTLAAAQAEAGDFNAAVSSQTRAIELLTDQRQQGDYRSRLVLYLARKPYRQESPEFASADARS